MKLRSWAAVPAMAAVLMAGGAGSTMAGFTAQATIDGSAQAVSLPQVLPLSLTPIESPDPGTPKSGPGQPASLGSITNDGTEAYAPNISISGISGVTLGGAPGTLAPGDSAPLTLNGLAHVKPGIYTIFVTAALGSFTETATDQVVVKKPKDDPPSDSPPSSGPSSKSDPTNSVSSSMVPPSP